MGGKIDDVDRRSLLLGASAAAVAGRGRARAAEGGKMQAALSPLVSKGEVPGLVALVDRAGVVEGAVLGTYAPEDGAPMARDTIFRIASVTKPMTAAAAMLLVEDGKLDLDAPVDSWLPELANRRVLKSLASDLDDTAPARRPITARDLATMRFGLGAIMEPPGKHPIQKAMDAAGVSPNAALPAHESPDAYMKALGGLPLVAQPGEAWLYNTGLDVLGVLIARVARQPLETFMQARLFAPLGMTDTGFSAPAAKLHRLPPCYGTDPESGAPTPFDAGGAESRFARAPGFPSGAGGLVSTADDILAFGRMMRAKGVHGGRRILSEASVAAMIKDQLTAAQRRSAHLFLEGRGWGLGMSVDGPAGAMPTTPAGFGWDGGYGTSWRTDPARDLVGVLLTQKVWTSPAPPPIHRAFWTAAYG